MGAVLVRFDSMETRDKVLQQGCYQFDKKSFILKPWHKDFQKEKTEFVPVWVQLPELDLKYWSPTALGKLASLLGTPIMADKNA